MEIRVKTRNPVALTCALALLLVLSAATTAAQSITGSIFGSVLDSTGSAVQGAQLKLVHSTTGAERVALTDARGEFAINALGPGRYSLTIEARGFKKLVRDDIELTPSERLSLGSLNLELGTVTEQIVVTAAATPVQTASAERSTSITASQVANLTIYGRTFTSLVAISPGVVDTVGANNRALGGGGGGGINFNIAGSRSANNGFTLDGVTLNAVGGAANASFGVSMESVSEVKVMVSNYQAEFGRMAGGNIQIVTKSGTKDYHGAGMYYVRNEALNANNFFNNRLGQIRPRNRYNAITYTLGGPVYIPRILTRQRQKLFFYWSHEYQPAKVTGALQNSTMPTAVERAGDFSQSLDQNNALMIIRDPTNNAPFQGNRIPLTRIDPNGQALLNVFPQPNFTDRSISKGAYNYVTQFTGRDPLRLYTLKLDYNLTTNDSLSVTLTRNSDDNSTPNGGGLTTPFALLPDVVHNAGQMGTVHWTHIISPRLVNEAVFGYAQLIGPTATGLDASVLKGIQTTTYNYTARQLNPASNPLNFVPGMSFGGVTGAASVTFDGRFPYFLTRYTTDYSDALSVTFGPHSVKAGVFIERMRHHDGGWATNFNGTFDFGRNVNNPLDTNNDRWQVSHKLTVSYGLRVDYFKFPRRAGTGVEFYNARNNTMVVCGIGPTPDDCGITRDRSHFTPRLGVAYRVTDSTVVRAGYSMVADPIFFEGHSQSGRENYPYSFAQLILPPNSLSYATTLRQGLPAVPTPDLSTGAAPIPGFAYAETYDNANYVRGYIQTWNFTVEKRVKEWLASAGYLGTRYVDAQSNLQMNWSPIGGGTAGQILNQMNGRTASTLYMGTMGTNTYDALQVRAQGRFRSGYQVGLSYAFSKSLGYATSASVQIPQYWRLNRGPQATDITHALCWKAC